MTNALDEKDPESGRRICVAPSLGGPLILLKQAGAALECDESWLSVSKQEDLITRGALDSRPSKRPGFCFLNLPLPVASYLPPAAAHFLGGFSAFKLTGKSVLALLPGC